MDRMLRKTEGLGRGAGGSALVETALSLSVLLTVMVGIMQLCLVLYSSIVVNEAAREATRYASVRGALSCKDLVTFPNCNMYAASASTVTATNPVGSNPLQTYVQGLGYPIPNRNLLNVSAAWFFISQDSNGASQWTGNTCVGQYEPGAAGASPNYLQCNEPGNMVTVTVTYTIPMYIPFWSNASVNLTSTSSMVIAQ